VEYRITAVISHHGLSDEIAERCLDALLVRHPENGPVVSQNTETGELTLTIALEATDPWAAAKLASEVIGGTLDVLALPMTEILDVVVALADREPAPEDVRELVGA